MSIENGMNIDLTQLDQNLREGKVEIVNIDEVTAGRFSLEPRWR
jgi:hypothetical protein